MSLGGKRCLSFSRSLPLSSSLLRRVEKGKEFAFSTFEERDIIWSGHIGKLYSYLARERCGLHGPNRYHGSNHHQVFIPFYSRVSVVHFAFLSLFLQSAGHIPSSPSIPRWATHGKEGHIGIYGAECPQGLRRLHTMDLVLPTYHIYALVD
ncbi:hypothetical protein B0T20DRAFT_180011 [Sordaria brevicollis]|uniref:Uncharacterized protein n=1 Tax=Sordaria brevicollis TaxID=83679 RepID=A0AAE0PHS3_SORBR|nr:hypothetical protein B0T20DRAFT_180011 [Sordaria brevicollis]